MYRASAKPPTTAWARHLDRVRRERDWSATELFEAVQGPLGLGPKSRSAFIPTLADKPMPAKWAAPLAAMFGEPGAEDQPPAPVTPDLATALLALASELTALREERQQLVARVTDLEATVAALAAPSVAGTGGGAAPRAPMLTAR